MSIIEEGRGRMDSSEKSSLNCFDINQIIIDKQVGVFSVL